MKKLDINEWIIFENDNYLIINKPPNVSSLDERLGTASSVLDLAREAFGDVQLCHRLDKETSGALLIAKNPEAYRNAAMQFEHRQVEKIYHAFVNGVHDFKELVIDQPLSITSKGLAKIDWSEGKESLTIANSLRAFRHFTVVECHPLTGRLHQIRIHMAYSGAPLISDVAYGGKYLYLSEIKRKKFKIGKFEEEQPLIKRAALHARSIALEDIDGKLIRAEAEYPKDIRALLHQLEQFDE
jgi:23S rRNA pseudouridine955/2504/2580 synthase